jgi:hypothetical protein
MGAGNITGDNRYVIEDICNLFKLEKLQSSHKLIPITSII